MGVKVLLTLLTHPYPTSDNSLLSTHPMSLFLYDLLIVRRIVQYPSCRITNSRTHSSV